MPEVVRGNAVTGAGRYGSPEVGGFGIAVVDGASRNRVEANTITGGRGPGILVARLDLVDEAEHNVLEGNLVNTAQSAGIFVGDGATGTRVTRNTAWGNRSMASRSRPPRRP